MFGFNGGSWFLGVIIDVENQERFPGDIHEQLPSAVRIQGGAVPVTNSDGEAPVRAVSQVAVFGQHVGALLQVHCVGLAVECGDMRVADDGAGT